MIKSIYNFFIFVFTKFIEYMISIESYADSEENFLDYYKENEVILVNDQDDDYGEFLFLKEEIDFVLNRELSFEKDILEQQERTWLHFTHNDKIPFIIKKNILEYIKRNYNLNSWWSKNNIKNEEGNYDYELTVEFFSPDDLREILRKKSENEFKFVLEMTHVEEDEDESSYFNASASTNASTDDNKNVVSYRPNINITEKQYNKKEKTWDGEWYKKNKDFKAKKEEFLKKETPKDDWMVVSKKKK